MADKHPYVQGPGALVQAVTHFRRSFPATVDAGALKKLGIAPNNESYYRPCRCVSSAARR